MDALSRIQTWLYDHLPIGVAILDRDLVYRYTNATYSAILGFASPQLNGRPLDCCQRDWAELIMRMIGQTRVNHLPAEEFNVPLTYPRQPSLQRIWDVTVLPILEEGEEQGFVLYIVDATSRRQAEDLSRSESRLRSILGAAVDAILVINEEGIIQQVNPATSRIFGYSEQELIGQPVTTIMPDPYREEHPQYMHRYMETGIPHIIGTIREVRGRCKNGETFPCELSVAESREQGDVRIFVGIIRDITDRKRVEEELRDERRRFQLLAQELESMLQSINIGVVVTDAENRVLRANDAVAHILGMSLSEIFGRRISEITNNVVGDELRRQVWQTGEPVLHQTVTYQLSHLPERGTSFWDMSIVPIRTPDGTIERLLTTLNDVTGYVQARQEAEFERARWLTTLNTLPQPVIFLDTDGFVRVANAAAEQLWQRPLVGGHWPDIQPDIKLLSPTTSAPLSPEERPLIRALHGETVHDYEVILERPDGTRIPMVLHAAPVKLEEKIVGAVEVGQDLTRVKEADRIKDQFLATVSHDLRSPMAAIQGWAQLAQESEDLSLMHQALDVVLRNIMVQQGLIDDLLDASALAAGMLSLAPREQDIFPLLRQQVEGLHATAQERGITLTFTSEEEHLQACVDVKRLQQIFGNLLSNALKYTQEGGKIEVRLRRLGDMIQFIVHDTGKGIPPSELPHIFERFYRSGSKPFVKGKSLGLGLSIVKALVELHGGTITVESPGEGKGSTFTVTLPLQCRWQPGMPHAA